MTEDAHCIELVHDLQKGKLTGVCVDSRQAQAGQLFFALPGERVDGHQFLQEVARAGVSEALVRRDYQGAHYGMRLHRVADVLDSLQRCAALRFRRLTGTVVGITGSYGKTTTKRFCQTILSKRFVTWSTPGNYNSQIGLPVALLNLSGDPEVVLLEMAMTQSGHIRRLVTLFPPDIAIITGVGLAHAENFSSIHDIAKAKQEILEASGIGWAIFAHEVIPVTPLFIPFATYSVKDESATFFAKTHGEVIELYEQGVWVERSHWCLPARHHLQNFLGAAALGRHLGLSWLEIVHAASELSAAPGRYQLHQLGDLTVIDDCYNANEQTVCAALDSMPAPRLGGRRIAVLAQMPELGHHSAACHVRVARHAQKRVDMLLCIGEKTRPMADLWLRAGRTAWWYADVSDAVRAISQLVRPGDVVLVKGGRSARLETLIQQLKPL